MSEENAAETFAKEGEHTDETHKTPGTMVLALVFLVSFAVYYFANWKALADVWYVR
jgi:cytochrome c oxidase subunit I